LPSNAEAPAFGEAAREFAAKVKGHTSKIVFMRDVNWPGMDVPSCIGAHDGQSAACMFPRRRPDDALAAAEIAGANAVFPGHILEVDPASLTCPSGMDKCPAVAPDGVIVFRDGAHLTASVARNLASGMYTLLAPTMGLPDKAAGRG